MRKVLVKDGMAGSMQWMRNGACVALLAVALGGAVAQETSNQAALSQAMASQATSKMVVKTAITDVRLTPEERAKDLVSHMTLEEKASQMINQARAIPRLGVPAYDWWNESLHGVMVNGTTEFPEPVGLGATFDPKGIHAMAEVIAVEGRIKHAQAVRAGHSDIYEGLDFWAPNINIFRDPRWGRGQETYGEDPFLSGRMGVAFVTGMQGNAPYETPKYYRAIATPKHFAVHSGPEPTRHMADVDVSRHDEMDTYLPAFRAAVTEGKAGSIMCSYNAINGEPGCANHFLMEDQLRGKWGFQGYLVSDCGAVMDIFHGHRYRPTQAQATAISVKRGMDNECADWFAKVKDDHDYRSYVTAVRQGYLDERDLDLALVRLFVARVKLGVFDPPETAPFMGIDEKRLDSAEHRALARKLANESMVLLKNDGVLPLKAGVKKIAVVGPLADQTRVLLGNYNGMPSHTVSVMEGMKAEFPNADIKFVAGTQFLRDEGTAVSADLLTTAEGKPGLKAEYGETHGLDQAAMKPLVTRVESEVDLTGAKLPAEVKDKSAFLVKWTGFLTPKQTGDYQFGMIANGFVQVSVDGKKVAMDWQTNGVSGRMGKVHFEKGQKVALELIYGPNGGPLDAKGDPEPEAKLIWAPVDLAPRPEAIAAAKAADVVVAVVGITSRLEGEEMPVAEEGFSGGDRTTLDLPKPEQALLEALAATGKPLVVVLMNGSALSVNWAKAHANAILEAWYAGEEGGAAVAETLAGKNNPAGRLPVTFYSDVSQLPHFEDYSMEGRTYRYFEGKPLFPFGYGLSYTSFAYSGLKLPTEPVRAGEPVEAEVTVTNSGKVAGDEVVQLYLSFPEKDGKPVGGAPLRALRAFERVHLEPGASQAVHFTLKDRALGMVTEIGDPIIAAGEYMVRVGGGQPETDAAGVSGSFAVEGQVALPE